MSESGNYVLEAAGDNRELIRLATHDDGDTCRITCTMRGEQHAAVADDFFEALCMLRRRFLEPMGLNPFCYGASLNVWPSGMARSMGRGLAAYRVKLDEKGGELVGIFDAGDDIQPATVAEQELFIERWLASTRP